MDSLWVIDMVIPKHVVVRNESPWMPFVTSIHAGEFDGIANKEHRQIVEDEVLVAVFGEEFE